MKKSKIIIVLRELKKKEQSRFLKYIQSPFFNKQQDVISLYEHILNYAPDFENKSLDKKTVQRQLGIKATKHFNYLCSCLLELLFDFLGYTAYEQNALEQKKNTLQVLRKKNITKPLSILFKQHEKLQENYLYKDAYLYEQQYLYYEEKDALFLLDSSHKYDTNLQLKSDSLDLYYILTKLKVSCDMASRNIIVKANYKPDLITEISHYLINNPIKYEEHPAIAIYHTILQMLEGEGGSIHYEKLKILLEQHIHLFSLVEGQQMFDYAQNYCIRQINRGEARYYQEFLNLYKMQLKSDTLLKDGFLEEWDFKNIVTVGVRLKDFEWTESFIHNNKKKLRATVRENAYHYNLAVYYYATSQYKKALQLLYQVEFTDITYHLGAKNIQLKSYYELDESEAFNGLVETFRIYVKRNKQLSEYRKEVYFNFLKIAKKIETLKGKKGFISRSEYEKKKINLQQYIANTNTANSDWIEEILAAL